MTHYQYYHDCLYNCINNCCNQFGTCPEDYINTIFANDKRYTQCYGYGDAHTVAKLEPLIDSSIYIAMFIAVALLLALISLINLYNYMSRLLKNKGQANLKTENKVEGSILEKKVEESIENCEQVQKSDKKLEFRLAEKSLDEQRKTLEI